MMLNLNECGSESQPMDACLLKRGVKSWSLELVKSACSLTPEWRELSPSSRPQNTKQMHATCMSD